MATLPFYVEEREIAAETSEDQTLLMAIYRHDSDNAAIVAALSRNPAAAALNIPIYWVSVRGEITNEEAVGQEIHRAYRTREQAQAALARCDSDWDSDWGDQPELEVVEGDLSDLDGRTLI